MLRGRAPSRGFTNAINRHASNTARIRISKHYSAAAMAGLAVIRLGPHEQRATYQFHLLHSHSKHQFTMLAGYLDNDLADDLSRNQLAFLPPEAPQAQSLPTPMPPRLPELLLDTAV